MFAIGGDNNRKLGDKKQKWIDYNSLWSHKSNIHIHLFYICINGVVKNIDSLLEYDIIFTPE